MYNFKLTAQPLVWNYNSTYEINMSQNNIDLTNRMRWKKQHIFMEFSNLAKTPLNAEKPSSEDVGNSLLLMSNNYIKVTFSQSFF